MSIETEGDAEGRPKIGCINKAFQLNTASFLLLKRFNILLGCKRVQYQQCDRNMTYYLVLKEEESFICESAKTSSPFPSSPEPPGAYPQLLLHHQSHTTTWCWRNQSPQYKYLWRGVRSGIQLSCTETQFQKCSQSSKQHKNCECCKSLLLLNVMIQI